MNELLKKTTKFVWTNDTQEAFEKLKEKLISAPILAYPDLSSDQELKLYSDASLLGSGYVLSQNQYDNVTGGLTERVIAYGSRNFTEVQQRYTVTERELLAVVFAVNKLHQYLTCKKFTIITDHSSLQWLMSKSLSNINARLARWVLCLSQYNFTIIHKAGTAIPHADALSRQNYNNASEEISFAVEPDINVLRSGNQKEEKNAKNDTPLGMTLPGLENLTTENLSEAQQNDYWYAAMINYLLRNELPSSRMLSQKIINNHQDYLVINNILYHTWNNKGSADEVVQQICITENFKNLVWKAMHVVLNSGHLGITKTFAKLRSRYFWPKMSAETAAFVQQCEVCAQANMCQQAKIPLQPLPVPSGPFERLHMDILRIATPSHGARLLVIICAFSKYVIAKTLKNKTSKSVAKVFFQHFVQTFGLPISLTITQDNGGEFRGSFNQALQTLLGVRSVFITPYSPASNGMIERTNRTLLSILRRYAMKEPSKWANYLPYAVLAINSSISETKQKTPYELIHGIAMREAIDLQIQPPSKFTTKDQQTAYQYWETQLKQIRSIARDRLLKNKISQKRQYDKSAKPSIYRHGDTVYLKRIMLGPTQDPKIAPKYTGPYIIDRLLSPTIAVLRDKRTNIKLPRSYHINKLKRVKQRQQKKSIITIRP